MTATKLWHRVKFLHFFCLSLLLHRSHSVTITERSNTEPNNSSMSVYRVSAPKSQQPSNRVPAHLQGIRSTGYVYDDADDVIHIIEPPQHFQQLKRRINQQGGAAVFAQQGKVRIMRPLAPTKVKEPLTKVERPAASPQMKHNGKPVVKTDQLPQESQLQEPHVPPPPLPLEILASVRKTERLLQQKQQLQKQQHFYPKQRQKVQQTHTVIMEKAFEREKYQRGKERRVGGQKWRRTRAKREAKSQGHDKGGNAAPQNFVADVLKDARQGVEKGQKLLLRLNELLKNADDFLPLEAKAENVSKKQEENKPTSRGSYNATIANQMSQQAETELQKILEHSLNATHLITREIERKSNETAEARRRRFGARLNTKSSPRALTPPARKERRTHSKRLLDPITTNQNGQTLATDETDSLKNAQLLYDDVMTNIRNMLQAHNLQLLEQQSNVQQPPSFNVSIPYWDGLTPTEAEGVGGELQQLQRYLHELQQLVIYWPPVGVGNMTLNTREFVRVKSDHSYGGGNERTRTATNWFLINGDGKIFPTPLNEQFKTNASIFYRFPDIPKEDQQKPENVTLLTLDLV